MVKYSLLFTDHFSLILSSSCLQSSVLSAIGQCPIPLIYRTHTQQINSFLLFSHIYSSPSLVFTSTSHPYSLPHLIISVQFYNTPSFFRSYVLPHFKFFHFTHLHLGFSDILSLYISLLRIYFPVPWEGTVSPLLLVPSHPPYNVPLSSEDISFLLILRIHLHIDMYTTTVYYPSVFSAKILPLYMTVLGH